MQTENKNGGHLYFQDFYLKDKKGAFFPLCWMTYQKFGMFLWGQAQWSLFRPWWPDLRLASSVLCLRRPQGQSDCLFNFGACAEPTVLCNLEGRLDVEVTIQNARHNAAFLLPLISLNIYIKSTTYLFKKWPWTSWIIVLLFLQSESVISFNVSV